MHRAETNRSSRVRMEAWRQWPLGGKRKTLSNRKNKRNPLDSDRPSHGRPLHVLTRRPREARSMSVTAIFRQLSAIEEWPNPSPSGYPPLSTSQSSEDWRMFRKRSLLPVLLGTSLWTHPLLASDCAQAVSQHAELRAAVAAKQFSRQIQIARQAAVRVYEQGLPLAARLAHPESASHRVCPLLSR